MFPKFTIPRMLAKAEQQRLLATVRAQGSRRDIALLMLALGTGLRLREIRGLNVSDVLEGGGDGVADRPGSGNHQGEARRRGLSDGSGPAGARGVPPVEAPARRAGQAGLTTLRVKAAPPAFASSDPNHVSPLAASGRVRAPLPLPRAQAHRDYERLPGHEGPLPDPALRPPRLPAHDYGLHASERRGAVRSDSGRRRMRSRATFDPKASSVPKP